LSGECLPGDWAQLSPKVSLDRGRDVKESSWAYLQRTSDICYTGLRVDSIRKAGRYATAE